MTRIAYFPNGHREWAGSRLRAYWHEDIDPIHNKVYSPGATLDGIEDYDAIVFQKRYQLADIERAIRLKYLGKKIILDLTDPMWWWSPKECTAMMELADVVTTSNDGLTDAVLQNDLVKRAVTIPDRMLASYHPSVVEHGERERVVLAWYGDSGNRLALTGYLPVLIYLAHRFPMELRIIDNDPSMKLMLEDNDNLKITHIPWTHETFHAQLVRCDIAYLPPYPGPWGMLKSNNRQVTAWWAGLPVVDGNHIGELASMIESVELRRQTAIVNRQIAERDWDVRQSVKELVALVEEIELTPLPFGKNGKQEAVGEPL